MDTEVGTYCKKCYIKKYKPSKKNIEHIVFFNYPERCDCCGKVERLVDYIEEED